MSQSVPIGRNHALDWLRIGAFALLIVTHIDMYFAPGHWVVKSMAPVDWIGWGMTAMHPWRLPLLFLVSGFASRALMRKLEDAGRFARLRSVRLLLPLVYGTIVIVAPQGWVRLVERGYSESFWHFWLHDWLRFTEIRGVPLPAVEHLWFIGYLWAYTMLLSLAAATFPDAWKRRLSNIVDRLSTGYKPLALPAALSVILHLSILFVIPQSGNLLTDWHGHLSYLPPFLFGFALAGAPRLWPAIVRCWRPAALMSLLCYAVLLRAEIRYPGDAVPPHLEEVLVASASAAMAWSMSLLLLAAAQRWLQRDHPLRSRLSEAVFPFYIAHQTIIVVVGWELRRFGLGAALEFLILMVATYAGCWAFYELGRRIGWLRPLVGLAPRKRGGGSFAPPLHNKPA